MRPTISLRTGFWAVVWGFSQLFMMLTTGRAEEPTQPRDRIVLTETYNAVTNIYLTNVATHSDSPNPNLAKRRFRVDLKYWLMDANRSMRLEVLFALLVLTGSAVDALATTRHYYIAAEEAMWNFAPKKQDLIHGKEIPSPYHTQWKKTRYIEYTDDTFTTRKSQPEWLGVLGPIIRAEVGDTVIVHFLNRAANAYSMHPHGFRYTKDHEGADYQGAGAGARVAPGRRFTYIWIADEESGPGPGDPTSIVWWYHSHVDEPRDINAGLLGPIIVTARGKVNADATPRDVDREFVTLFMIFDEEQDPKNKERGMMYSINGYVFGNLPGLTMKTGEKVRWYLLGMGNEQDLHTAHWHGKTVHFGTRHTDVIELLPASMVTVDMRADNPGTWLYHCHVADHLDGGMLALFTIEP